MPGIGIRGALGGAPVPEPRPDVGGRGIELIGLGGRIGIGGAGGGGSIVGVIGARPVPAAIAGGAATPAEAAPGGGFMKGEIA